MEVGTDMGIFSLAKAFCGTGEFSIFLLRALKDRLHMPTQFMEITT